MEQHTKQGPTDAALTAWRKSYSRLRELERRLVSASRAAQDPAEIDNLYREVEALRSATTEMFTVAQIESVSRHVMQYRIGSCLQPLQRTAERH
jgi:hypothetical protein